MSLASLPERIRDDLNRFHDRTGVPINVILNYVVALLVPLPKAKVALLIKAIASSVEAVVKKGSVRYRLSDSTRDLINGFLEERGDNFPYTSKYRTITYYHTANTGQQGITFLDRIYFSQRPMRDEDGYKLIFHELVHTYQYKKYGQIVFSAVYVGDYLANLIKERNPDIAYGNINFEREAFHWEEEFVDWLHEKGVVLRPTMFA